MRRLVGALVITGCGSKAAPAPAPPSMDTVAAAIPRFAIAAADAYPHDCTLGSIRAYAETHRADVERLAAATRAIVDAGERAAFCFSLTDAAKAQDLGPRGDALYDETRACDPVFIEWQAVAISILGEHLARCLDYAGESGVGD